MDTKNKLEEIGVKNLDSLSADQVDILYKHYQKQKNKKKTSKKDNDVVKSSVDSAEYKVVLKYCNGLLQNMNRNQIDKLEDFVDVPREDILTDNNKQLLKSMEGDIFKCSKFNKNDCNYYKKLPEKPLNILRYMVKKTGLTLKSFRKRKYFDNKMSCTIYYYIS